jgi:hypothetical protein
MLDAHPDMAIPPETGFIPQLYRLRRWPIGLRKHLSTMVTRAPSWADFDLAPEAFRQALHNLAPFTLSEGIRAFYRLYAQRFEKHRWGDKTPTYGLHLRTLQRLLPEARFIHLIRDGRDVALSMRGLWFAPGTTIDALATDWCRRITTIRRLGRRCYHYFEVRYETLVREPVETLAEICRFVELPYSPQMHGYFNQARSRLDELKTWLKPDGSVLISKEERLFNHRFTNQPPDASRVFRWKRDMTQEMREQFERIAGPLLEELGYERTMATRRWTCRLRAHG